MSTVAIGGRYVVEDALGRGGMAAVFRVRDAHTGQRLALKRAWARDAARTQKRRALLEREFHTLAQLHHPRIIEVYDFGVDDDGPYYTMELLDGVDLDNAGALPWQTACSLVRDIASSLAILHSRGLLHRDVSGRNVRLTADGHAKLIDFGTMLSMGIVDVPIGTPPFMAPEVLQMQALDARADLYSLGALAYHALTGRHAYPAARASDLRDVWRSRPVPPQRIRPEIPATLNTLVMSLLSLDRAARPQTAGEVMERLGAIADLPKEELPEIARAYLTTPSLVGREQGLIAVRTRMLAVVRNEGGMVVIEGSPGMGRSRMLDASGFEAKLLGTHVARSSAADAAGETWGVARKLCSQLFALFPEEAEEASRLASGVLRHVLNEVARSAAATTTTTTASTTPERSVILRELRDLILALAGKQRILLVVDDADRIDEPSLALLAALADKCDDKSLLVVLAMGPEGEQPRSASLALVRKLAHCVQLPPLDLDQTLGLLRSVFGDVPNVELCAGRIYALAQGSPRTTMELAQHLVDRGLARYEAGRFRLPAQLDERDLPATLAASLELRIAELSPDAQELATALAIAEGLHVPLESYRSLTSHGDAARVFTALEDLVTARVLSTASDEHRFSQRGFVRLLMDTRPSLKRTLHGRIAELLATQGGDPIRRAHHTFHAGREPAALEILCSIDLQQQPPPLALLEQAVQYAETHAATLAARTLQRLRMALLSQASLLLAVRSFKRCLGPVLHQLEQDTGLALYRELEGVPAEARLSQALTRQQQRYLATPPRDQVYDVTSAIRELARLTGATCSMAATVQDLSLLDQLPALQPILPVSPALGVVSHLRDATRALVRGQRARAVTDYEAALARIAQPDRAGLDDVQHSRTLLGVHYGLALTEAAIGLPRVEDRLRILEGHRALRVAASRVRSVLALSQGNVELAQRHARRAELLRLQDDEPSYYASTDVSVELWALHQLGDLLGVKTALDTIIQLAQQYPGWQAFLPYAHSCYLLLQGDAQAARREVAPACARLRPGIDAAFAWSAYQHVRVLREIGATAESLEIAGRYADDFRTHELTSLEPYLQLELSLLEAQAGEYDCAIARLDPVLREREAAGACGLALGTFYESRARIALWMRDRAGYERFAAQCAEEYAKGRSPHLHVMYARLREEARQHEGAAARHAALPDLASLPAPHDDTDLEGLRNRLSECVDAADRARCVLTLLLQSTESYLGHLYGVEEGRLVALAGLPETSAEPALERWLAGWVVAERERAREGVVTGTATHSSRPPPPSPLDAATHSVDGQEPHVGAMIHTDCEGRRFLASTLAATEGRARTLVALLAVQITGQHLPNPPVALRTRLAALLLEHHDVSGLKLVAQPEE